MKMVYYVTLIAAVCALPINYCRASEPDQEMVQGQSSVQKAEKKQKLRKPAWREHLLVGGISVTYTVVVKVISRVIMQKLVKKKVISGSLNHNDTIVISVIGYAALLTYIPKYVLTKQILHKRGCKLSVESTVAMLVGSWSGEWLVEIVSLLKDKLDNRS